MENYQKGEVGTSMEKVSSDEILFPSLTICLMPHESKTAGKLVPLPERQENMGNVDHVLFMENLQEQVQNLPTFLRPMKPLNVHELVPLSTYYI